jgi:D-tyrosyl-tRNA(Tyr) deacylase
MKAVVQRVRNATVTVDNAVTGSIARGLLVYLGVAGGDGEKDADWIAEKVANLRIFEDAQGKMNLSLLDIVSLASPGEGSTGVLTVSQFTLLADARKGRRPYYGDAAPLEKANALYEYFMKKIRDKGLISEAGVFQAHMDVSYTNDGPVTILLDSKESLR